MPLYPPDVIYLVNAPSPSQIFTTLQLHCIIDNATYRTENRVLYMQA